MFCFHLHFSDFNLLFFQKNKKNLLQFTFEKIPCRKEKSQVPDGYQIVQPLSSYLYVNDCL